MKEETKSEKDFALLLFDLYLILKAWFSMI